MKYWRETFARIAEKNLEKNIKEGREVPGAKEHVVRIRKEREIILQDGHIGEVVSACPRTVREIKQDLEKKEGGEEETRQDLSKRKPAIKQPIETQPTDNRPTENIAI